MCRVSLVAALLLLAAAAPTPTLQVSGGSQFALWQRYGRDASALLPPRADRFFMTSRYGKRVESVQDGGLPPPIPDVFSDVDRTELDERRTEPDRGRTEPDESRSKLDERRLEPDERRPEPNGRRTEPDVGARIRRRLASDDLQCQYVGFSDLYRCRSTNKKILPMMSNLRQLPCDNNLEDEIKL